MPAPKFIVPAFAISALIFPASIVSLPYSAMVKSLPEKHSTVVYLYYYEGYSIKEISQITGIKENSVGTLLKRGRAKLKLQLEASGYERAGV